MIMDTHTIESMATSSLEYGQSMARSRIEPYGQFKVQGLKFKGLIRKGDEELWRRFFMNGLEEEALDGVEEFVDLRVATQSLDEVQEDSHIVQWTNVITIEYLF